MPIDINRLVIVYLIMITKTLEESAQELEQSIKRISEVTDLKSFFQTMTENYEEKIWDVIPGQVQDIN